MKTSDLLLEIEELKKEIEKAELEITDIEKRLLCSSNNCWFDMESSLTARIHIPERFNKVLIKQSFEYVENEKFRLKLLNDKLETLLNKEV